MRNNSRQKNESEQKASNNIQPFMLGLRVGRNENEHPDSFVREIIPVRHNYLKSCVNDTFNNDIALHLTILMPFHSGWSDDVIRVNNQKTT